MVEMPQERKDEIKRVLEERGALSPCARCGKHKFTLMGGYFSQVIQLSLDGLMLGGPSIPSAVLSCDWCGHLIQHALGALGLLEEKPDEAEGNGDEAVPEASNE